MTIEKTSQGIRITDIVKGEYISKHYIGYSKKEAVKRFKQGLR